MSTPRWANIPNLIALLTMLGGFVTMLWSVGWGFLILGGGLLGIASITQYVQYLFIKRAFHAHGIVIAHQKRSSDDGGAWFPIVRYVLPDRREITFQSRAFWFLQSLPVSAEVAVLYDPDNPESVIIDRPIEKFGVSIAILFAIFLMIVGILILGGLLHLSKEVG